MINPYTPEAGAIPSYLAGRDWMIKRAKKIFEDLVNGICLNPIIFYGLRGSGKSVLLNAIENIANQEKIHYLHMEMSESEGIVHALSIGLMGMFRKKNLKESTLEKVQGLLDFLNDYFATGDRVHLMTAGEMKHYLTQLLLCVGEVMQSEQEYLCLFVDELQCGNEQDMEALFQVLYRLKKSGLPIAFFGAGLPVIVRQANKILPDAEHVFDFIQITSLRFECSRRAFAEPLRKNNIDYEDQAINKMVELTAGWPYFIQEYGRQVWKKRTGNKITIKSVNDAKPEFMRQLDKFFFKKHIDKATRAGKNFMRAMALLGSGPYEVSKIADCMHRKVKSVNPVKSNLIYKGLIFCPYPGAIAFTVPQFDKYIRRASLAEGELF